MTAGPLGRSSRARPPEFLEQTAPCLAVAQFLLEIFRGFCRRLPAWLWFHFPLAGKNEILVPSGFRFFTAETASGPLGCSSRARPPEFLEQTVPCLFLLSASLKGLAALCLRLCLLYLPCVFLSACMLKQKRQGKFRAAGIYELKADLGHNKFFFRNGKII